MDIPVDIVYTWCDSADEKWAAKKDAVARSCGLPADSRANAACRFAGGEDIKFALRSMEACAPWIRTVFLVVDDDASLPPWLDTGNPKLRIVRHSEIIPARFLPTFDSSCIEHHLAHIPALSERFLCANDDMMFYRKVEPSFFYAADGLPYCRFAGKPRPADWKPANPYESRLRRALDLVLSRHPHPGRQLRSAAVRYPHHNIDAYLRSDLLATFDRYSDEIAKTLGLHFRSKDTVQRIVYYYEALATGRGHYRLARRAVGVKRSWIRSLLRPAYAESLQFVRKRWKTGLDELRQWRPGLFCFNDTLEITDEDRAELARVYGELFPEKSSFEK